VDAVVVKPPVRFQVCPQCGWSEEQGHRWDRRRQIYKTFWRSTRCPNCDVEPVRECPNCSAPIPKADADACERCGETYPWRKD